MLAEFGLTLARSMVKVGELHSDEPQGLCAYLLLLHPLRWNITGRGPVTDLEAGSTFNVSWYLGYAHRVITLQIVRSSFFDVKPFARKRENVKNGRRRRL